ACHEDGHRAAIFYGIRLSPPSARKVRVVLFVFEAVMLEEIRVWEKLFDDAERDGLGEGQGIGNDDGEIQMPVIATAEAFLDTHLCAVAGAARVQPAVIVEARRLDHQRFTFPSADRISLPGWRRIDGQLATIGEDLTKSGLDLVQNDNHARGMNDLERL